MLPDGIRPKHKRPALWPALRVCDQGGVLTTTPGAMLHRWHLLAATGFEVLPSAEAWSL
jgi:hypothetical protein